MDNKYVDIINLPHHVSTKHPQMSIESRSAQFAPFAALVGYDEAVKNTIKKVEKDGRKSNDTSRQKFYRNM